MDEKERLVLKEKIIEQLIQTEKLVASLREDSKPIAPENAIGRLTRMEAINSKAIQEEALRITERKLVKLKRAVRRIDDDPDFGYCEDCGELIAIKRLALMPEASLCVKCAD